MVLSNKKLKQKLRSSLSESLAASESQKNPTNNDSTNSAHPNSKTHQTLKSLLDSATQKPRVSKREKRRAKTPFLQGAEVVNRSDDGDREKENGESGLEGVGENKRKRKRDGEEGEGLENVEEELKKKLDKKKKKKKTKKVKKGENGNVKKGVESENGGSEAQSVAETIKTSDSQVQVEGSTKVYVGGIPYYSTEDDIRSFFEACGTITEVDCMTFPESGKFRGIAIISFKTEAASKRALALDGADMGGLYLKTQPYKTTRDNKVSDFSPAIVEGYNRIYVGNLSWDITEDELRKFFSDFSISSIRFGEDKETGEFRGYAHVDFADSLSVTMSLKLDQQVICGRPVRIRCAVPKKVAETNSKSVPTSKKADNVEVSSISGKIRRRTCYECGERGHLSSSCPKKQAAEP